MGRFDKAYRKANDPDRKPDGREGFGDDGGARVGRPDEGSSDEATGAGAEATRGTGGSADGHDREHHSRYGGKGGRPKRPQQ